jgi:dimethylargininase
VEVLYHDSHLPDLADSIFVHDPVLLTNKGVIQLRMGKPLRRGEESALRKYINSLGVPTVSVLSRNASVLSLSISFSFFLSLHPSLFFQLYELHGDATAEGGDTLWLDEHTLAVGR